MLRGQRPLICSAWGHPEARRSLLSCALLASACPWGEHQIMGCVPRRPVLPPSALLELHPWGRTAPSSRSLHPEPPARSSGVQPGVHRIPLGISSAGCGPLSPGLRCSLSAPGSLRASLALLGSCSNSQGAPFHPGRLVKLLLFQEGLSCPEGTRWGFSPAPRGAPPPWMPFFLFFFFFIFFPYFILFFFLLFLYFFFPSPTLIEARTLLTVAFQLVSL